VQRREAPEVRRVDARAVRYKHLCHFIVSVRAGVVKRHLSRDKCAGNEIKYVCGKHARVRVCLASVPGERVPRGRLGENHGHCDSAGDTAVAQ